LVKPLAAFLAFVFTDVEVVTNRAVHTQLVFDNLPFRACFLDFRGNKGPYFWYEGFPFDKDTEIACVYRLLQFKCSIFQSCCCFRTDVFHIRGSEITVISEAREFNNNIKFYNSFFQNRTSNP